MKATILTPALLVVTFVADGGRPPRTTNTVGRFLTAMAVGENTATRRLMKRAYFEAPGRWLAASANSTI